eukprot:TRINITY_DN70983_c0_g1_i1.p1 TRINITY_DN70983_c0_g1~~TRINITY_DN70983_c0_g1_i1.p1  ORF type:complete len:535 (-),score=108.17 TRINITY_DN70983_c0_g1_i1:207-1811(-)
MIRDCRLHFRVLIQTRIQTNLRWNFLVLGLGHFGAPIMSERVRTKVGRGAQRRAVGASTTVLTGSDLHTLSSLLHGDTADQAVRDRAVRESLQTMSRERAAKWGNTFEALQKKKDDDRAATDEARLRELQKRQEELEAEQSQRRDALERARKLALSQSDRVRTFRGQLRLADVLDERAKQVADKAATRDAAVTAAADDDRKLTQSLRFAAAEERAAAARRQQEARERAAVQRAQMDDEQARMMARLAADRAEGEKLREAAIRAQEEERTDRDRRRRQARGVAEECAEQNRHLQHLKQEAHQREVLEDVRIAAFARVKDQQVSMRRAVEEQKRRETLARRADLIERQSAVLKALQTDEDARVASQVASAEAAYLSRVEDEDRTRKRSLEEVRRMRDAQVAAREAQRAADLEDERQRIAADHAAHEAAMVGQMTARSAARRRAIAVSDEQRAVADLRKARQEAEQQRDREDYNRRLAEGAEGDATVARTIQAEYDAHVATRPPATESVVLRSYMGTLGSVAAGTMPATAGARGLAI